VSRLFRIFRMSLKEMPAAQSSRLCGWPYARPRRTASTRSSSPAGECALISSWGQDDTLLQYVPRPFQIKVQHLFQHYMKHYLWRRAAQRRNRAARTAKEARVAVWFRSKIFTIPMARAQREGALDPEGDQTYREAAQQRVERVREPRRLGP